MGEMDRVTHDLVITTLWAMERHPRMIEAQLGCPNRGRPVPAWYSIALREMAGHRIAVELRTGPRAQRTLRGPVHRVPRAGGAGPGEVGGAGRPGIGAAASPLAAAPP